MSSSVTGLNTGLKRARVQPLSLFFTTRTRRSSRLVPRLRGRDAHQATRRPTRTRYRSLLTRTSLLNARRLPEDRSIFRSGYPRRFSLPVRSGSTREIFAASPPSATPRRTRYLRLLFVFPVFSSPSRLQKTSRTVTPSAEGTRRRLYPP